MTFFVNIITDSVFHKMNFFVKIITSMKEMYDKYFDDFVMYFC